jgi:hypothetical protein
MSYLRNTCLTSVFLSIALLLGCIEADFEAFNEKLACSLFEDWADNDFYIRYDDPVGTIIGQVYIPGENCDFDEFKFSGGDDYFMVREDGDIEIIADIMPLEGTTHSFDAFAEKGSETLELTINVIIIEAPLPAFGAFFDAGKDTLMSISHSYLRLDTIANWYVQRYYFSYRELQWTDSTLIAEGNMVQITLATTQTDFAGTYYQDSLLRDQHIFVESSFGGDGLNVSLIGFYYNFNPDADEFAKREISDAIIEIDTVNLNTKRLVISGTLTNDKKTSMAFNFDGDFNYLLEQ